MKRLRLKPCPFCGNNRLRVNFWLHEIECTACGILVYFDMDSNLDQVAAAWNRRAVLNFWREPQFVEIEGYYDH